MLSKRDVQGGRWPATFVADAAGTPPADDRHTTIGDDAVIYDRTLSGDSRLRFQSFTTFDPCGDDTVLDVTVRPPKRPRPTG